MRRPQRLKLAAGFLFACTGCGGGRGGDPSSTEMLPADNEVGSWARTGEAQVISEEAALYSLIDGGASKYIAHGWVSSVYVEYRQGAASLQVAIHDMGSRTNAEGIFKMYLPVARQPVNDSHNEPHENAVVDLGLPDAYAVFAFMENYYIQLSIDERSDASLVSIMIFTNQILARGTQAQAGSNMGDHLKRRWAAARVTPSPKGVAVLVIDRLPRHPGEFPSASGIDTSPNRRETDFSVSSSPGRRCVHSPAVSG
jgi:hypothetical protein